MGDGFIKFFSLILSISNSEDGFIFIDEIENGLHYSAQQITWEAIFSTAETFNVQIFATTHSFECVQSYISATPEAYKTKDAIRMFRIEKTKSGHSAIDFDYGNIAESIDSNWEIR